MREIKFRAWDLLKREMVYPTIIDNPSMTEVDTETHKQQFVLQQYTGLKDKNGREIYEGDVVSRFGGTQRAAVYFEDGCFVSMIQYSGDGPPKQEILCNDIGVTKVIGNIYENPELLEDGE